MNALWCSFVCSDHHKDRNCHFELRLKFSEKESPKWLALHLGYLYDMPPGKFDSLAEAANYLVQNMEKALGEGLAWKKFQIEDETGMRGENCKKELKVLPEIKKTLRNTRRYFSTKRNETVQDSPIIAPSPTICVARMSAAHNSGTLFWAPERFS